VKLTPNDNGAAATAPLFEQKYAGYLWKVHIERYREIDTLSIWPFYFCDKSQDWKHAKGGFKLPLERADELIKAISIALQSQASNGLKLVN
jgi:hypothetical protein